MGPQLLVESRIADGQKLIDQLVRDGFPVTVAFWVKASEEGFWRLYIAAPSVQIEKIGEAYRVVYASLRQLTNPLVELSEIKLIPAISPIARDAVSVRDQYYAGKSPTKYDGQRLGNLAIDEAYIYAPPGKWFKGFDEIKRDFPSAEAFIIPVLNTDVTLATVSPYMGQLNAGVFEGKAPGTVMFVGPEGSSGKPIGELVFVYRPEGWNTLYRPETQRWEEVRFIATGEPPYRSVDFTPLAALRTRRKPCEDNIDFLIHVPGILVWCL